MIEWKKRTREKKYIDWKSFGCDNILNDIKVRADVWYIHIIFGVMKTHKWSLMLQFINKSSVPFNFITPSSSLLFIFRYVFFSSFVWCVCIDRLQVIYSLIMFTIIISPSFMTLVEILKCVCVCFLHFTINKLLNFI